MVTMPFTARIVIALFKVKLSDMQSKKRTKRIAFPRQVCMCLARELTDLTLADIGAHSQSVGFPPNHPPAAPGASRGKFRECGATARRRAR